MVAVKMPDIWNARLWEILEASEYFFSEMQYLAILYVEIVRIVISNCTQYIVYSITFPMIGFNFLCGKYCQILVTLWLQKWRTAVWTVHENIE